MLMQEIVELNEDIEIEKTVEPKNELENQIEIMRTDLINAQRALSRLEQFETEKLRLKEDLEVKIEEFNMLTEHYQHEKENYLHVLQHIQDQVNIYKEHSQKFDTEKGSWSKQIDELKSELMQTKATLVKKEELEQKNAQLQAELQTKEMEMYRLKKDNERALAQQLEQFKVEMKMHQDKIAQYEKDREIWEKQMKQMKAQFAGLEANLEEKENFIKQFIKQPLSSSTPYVQSSNEQFLQTQTQSQTQSLPQLQSKSEEAPAAQNRPSIQSSPQSSDWLLRMMNMQAGANQQSPNNPKSSSSSIDFFTLRSKTTQAAVSGPSYGGQWGWES